MPRPISLKLVLKVLRKKGFLFVRQKGSHARYEKATKNGTLKVTIRLTKKEIPYGTFAAILLQTKLNEEDFRKKKA